jgi:hypothetical protein
MEEHFRDRWLWTGIKEKLVRICGGEQRLSVLTITVAGDNESEIMKLIRSVPKETDKV